MRQIIAFTIWFSAVAWHWSTAVPVAPTYSIPVDSNQWARVVQDDSICLLRKNPPRPENRLESRGPIEFWDLSERKKTRELLTVDDEVQIVTHKMCLVHRNGQTRCIDLNNGETLSVVPQSHRVSWLFPADDYRFLYFDGNVLRFFDSRQGKEIWATTGYSLLAIPVGQKFVITRNDAAQKNVALDQKTGQVDPRFDRFNFMDLVLSSPDGRLIGIHTDRKFIVCDSETLDERWSIPRLTHGEFFWFNAKGDQVSASFADSLGQVTVARWKADDGTVLSPRPANSNFHFASSESIGDRYAIRSATVDAPFSRKLNKWLKFIGASGLPERRKHKTIVDLETSATIGVLNGEWLAQRLADESGFIIQQHDLVNYYTLPPKRNWRWLATWGLVPPTVVEGLRRLWQKRRRRRLATPSPIDPASCFEKSSG